VILHDSGWIYEFGKHDIIVPIVVLEELDRFKKGGGTLNFHAREFGRSLDSLSGNRLFNGGVKIGPAKGKISIRLDEPLHPDLALSFSARRPYHQILNTAYRMAKTHPYTSVVLVTKDVNLRMKAKSIGMMAQDYTRDHVKDVASLYRGHRLVEGVAPRLIDRLFGDPSGIEPGELAVTPLPNGYLILCNGKKSVLAVFDAADRKIVRVEKLSAYGIRSRNAEQAFTLHALLNVNIPLVTV